MSKSFKDDASIIKALQGDELSRREALSFFFKNPALMSWVVRYVHIQGGSTQDAKDVFEEAFIIFERQLRTGNFRGESSLVTWFHGIARWQWVIHRRKQRPFADIDDIEAPSDVENPEKLYISEERRVILERLLAQVGERCQKLLAYFQLNYSMREIQSLVGYASPQVAANEVGSCREKLKKIAQQQPDILDALKNRP